ncbi:hypothetical protein CGC20_38515 [Leishmania donovani]|uniref:Uncharacterized protein n=1 Tax=Leishmania donovani TaxID=5661 RepID=A0A504XXW6_LEIDO|nr:hypothetical protein CGC20_38515 [Leishmania donovani]
MQKRGDNIIANATPFVARTKTSGAQSAVSSCPSPGVAVGTSSSAEHKKECASSAPSTLGAAASPRVSSADASAMLVTAIARYVQHRLTVPSAIDDAGADELHSIKKGGARRKRSSPSVSGAACSAALQRVGDSDGDVNAVHLVACTQQVEAHLLRCLLHVELTPGRLPNQPEVIGEALGTPSTTTAAGTMEASPQVHRAARRVVTTTNQAASAEGEQSPPPRHPAASTVGDKNSCRGNTEARSRSQRSSIAAAAEASSSPRVRASSGGIKAKELYYTYTNQGIPPSQPRPRGGNRAAVISTSPTRLPSRSNSAAARDTMKDGTVTLPPPADNSEGDPPAHTRGCSAFPCSRGGAVRPLHPTEIRAALRSWPSRIAQYVLATTFAEQELRSAAANAGGGANDDAPAAHGAARSDAPASHAQEEGSASATASSRVGDGAEEDEDEDEAGVVIDVLLRRLCDMLQHTRLAADIGDAGAGQPPSIDFPSFARFYLAGGDAGNIASDSDTDEHAPSQRFGKGGDVHLYLTQLAQVLLPTVTPGGASASGFAWQDEADSIEGLALSGDIATDIGMLLKHTPLITAPRHPSELPARTPALGIADINATTPLLTARGALWPADLISPAGVTTTAAAAPASDDGLRNHQDAPHDPLRTPVFYTAVFLEVTGEDVLHSTANDEDAVTLEEESASKVRYEADVPEVYRDRHRRRMEAQNRRGVHYSSSATHGGSAVRSGRSNVNGDAGASASATSGLEGATALSIRGRCLSRRECALWEKLLALAHFVHVSGTPAEVETTARYVTLVIRRRRGARQQPQRDPRQTSSASATPVSIAESAALPSVPAFFFTLTETSALRSAAATAAEVRQTLFCNDHDDSDDHDAVPFDAAQGVLTKAGSASSIAAAGGRSHFFGSSGLGLRALLGWGKGAATAPPDQPVSPSCSLQDRNTDSSIRARPRREEGGPPCRAPPTEPPPPAVQDESTEELIMDWMHDALIPLFFETTVSGSVAPHQGSAAPAKPSEGKERDDSHDDESAVAATAGRRRAPYHLRSQRVLLGRVQAVTPSMVYGSFTTTASSATVALACGTDAAMEAVVRDSMFDANLLPYLLLNQLFFAADGSSVNAAHDTFSSPPPRARSAPVPEQTPEHPRSAAAGQQPSQQATIQSHGLRPIHSLPASATAAASAHSPNAHGRRVSFLEDASISTPLRLDARLPVAESGVGSPLLRQSPNFPSATSPERSSSIAGSPRSILKSGRRYKREKLIRSSAPAASVVPFRSLFLWRLLAAEVLGSGALAVRVASDVATAVLLAGLLAEQYACYRQLRGHDNQTHRDGSSAVTERDHSSIHCGAAGSEKKHNSSGTPAEVNAEAARWGALRCDDLLPLANGAALAFVRAALAPMLCYDDGAPAHLAGIIAEVESGVGFSDACDEDECKCERRDDPDSDQSSASATSYVDGHRGRRDVSKDGATPHHRRTSAPSAISLLSPSLPADVLNRLQTLSVVCLLHIRQEVLESITRPLDVVMRRLTWALARLHLHALCRPLDDFLRRGSATALLRDADGSAQGVHTEHQFWQLVREVLDMYGECLMLPHLLDAAAPLLATESSGVSSEEGDVISPLTPYQESAPPLSFTAARAVLQPTPARWSVARALGGWSADSVDPADSYDLQSFAFDGRAMRLTGDAAQGAGCRRRSALDGATNDFVKAATSALGLQRSPPLFASLCTDGTMLGSQACVPLAAGTGTDMATTAPVLGNCFSGNRSSGNATSAVASNSRGCQLASKQGFEAALELHHDCASDASCDVDAALPVRLLHSPPRAMDVPAFAASDTAESRHLGRSPSGIFDFIAVATPLCVATAAESAAADYEGSPLCVISSGSDASKRRVQQAQISSHGSSFLTPIFAVPLLRRLQTAVGDAVTGSTARTAGESPLSPKGGAEVAAMASGTSVKRLVVHVGRGVAVESPLLSPFVTEAKHMMVEALLLRWVLPWWAQRTLDMEQKATQQPQTVKLRRTGPPSLSRERRDWSARAVPSAATSQLTKQMAELQRENAELHGRLRSTQRLLGDIHQTCSVLRMAARQYEQAIALQEEEKAPTAAEPTTAAPDSSLFLAGGADTLASPQQLDLISPSPLSSTPQVVPGKGDVGVGSPHGDAAPEKMMATDSAASPLESFSVTLPLADSISPQLLYFAQTEEGRERVAELCQRIIVLLSGAANVEDSKDNAKSLPPSAIAHDSDLPSRLPSSTSALATSRSFLLHSLSQGMQGSQCLSPPETTSVELAATAVLCSDCSVRRRHSVVSHGPSQLFSPLEPQSFRRTSTALTLMSLAPAGALAMSNTIAAETPCSTPTPIAVLILGASTSQHVADAVFSSADVDVQRTILSAYPAAAPSHASSVPLTPKDTSPLPRRAPLWNQATPVAPQLELEAVVASSPCSTTPMVWLTQVRHAPLQQHSGSADGVETYAHTSDEQQHSRASGFAAPSADSGLHGTQVVTPYHDRRQHHGRHSENGDGNGDDRQAPPSTLSSPSVRSPHLARQTSSIAESRGSAALSSSMPPPLSSPSPSSSKMFSGASSEPSFEVRSRFYENGSAVTAAIVHSGTPHAVLIREDDSDMQDTPKDEEDDVAGSVAMAVGGAKLTGKHVEVAEDASHADHEDNLSEQPAVLQQTGKAPDLQRSLCDISLPLPRMLPAAPLPQPSCQRPPASLAFRRSPEGTLSTSSVTRRMSRHVTASDDETEHVSHESDGASCCDSVLPVQRAIASNADEAGDAAGQEPISIKAAVLPTRRPSLPTREDANGSSPASASSIEREQAALHVRTAATASSSPWRERAPVRNSEAAVTALADLQQRLSGSNSAQLAATEAALGAARHAATKLLLSPSAFSTLSGKERAKEVDSRSLTSTPAAALVETVVGESKAAAAPVASVPAATPPPSSADSSPSSLRTQPLRRVHELEDELRNANFRMGQWRALLDAERHAHVVQVDQLTQRLESEQRRSARASRSRSRSLSPLSSGTGPLPCVERSARDEARAAPPPAPPPSLESFPPPAAEVPRLNLTTGDGELPPASPREQQRINTLMEQLHVVEAHAAEEHAQRVAAEDGIRVLERERRVLREQLEALENERAIAQVQQRQKEHDSDQPEAQAAQLQIAALRQRIESTTDQLRTAEADSREHRHRCIIAETQAAARESAQKALTDRVLVLEEELSSARAAHKQWQQDADERERALRREYEEAAADAGAAMEAQRRASSERLQRSEDELHAMQRAQAVRAEGHRTALEEVTRKLADAEQAAHLALDDLRRERETHERTTAALQEAQSEKEELHRRFEAVLERLHLAELGADEHSRQRDRIETLKVELEAARAQQQEAVEKAEDALRREAETHMRTIATLQEGRSAHDELRRRLEEELQSEKLARAADTAAHKAALVSAQGQVSRAEQRAQDIADALRREEQAHARTLAAMQAAEEANRQLLRARAAQEAHAQQRARSWLSARETCLLKWMEAKTQLMVGACSIIGAVRQPQQTPSRVSPSPTAAGTPTAASAGPRAQPEMVVVSVDDPLGLRYELQRKARHIASLEERVHQLEEVHAADQQVVSTLQKLVAQEEMCNGNGIAAAARLPQPPPPLPMATASWSSRSPLRTPSRAWQARDPTLLEGYRSPIALLWDPHPGSHSSAASPPGTTERKRLTPNEYRQRYTSL